MIGRLTGAVLMEQNDDRQTQNRVLQIEGFTKAQPAAIEWTLSPLRPKTA